MANRIGILGGSFDPIHIGHLIIAQDAIEQFDLERVLFVPAYQAPLKAKASVASPEQRLEMTRLAIADDSRFQISKADFLRGEISFSVATARRLKEQFPQEELFWIVGADQVAQLHQWRDITELARLVSFIAFARPGPGFGVSDKLPEHVRVLMASKRELELSSTEIRARLNSGRSAKYFLPEAVFAYIKAENLYR